MKRFLLATALVVLTGCFVQGTPFDPEVEACADVTIYLTISLDADSVSLATDSTEYDDECSDADITIR